MPPPAGVGFACRALDCTGPQRGDPASGRGASRQVEAPKQKAIRRAMTRLLITEITYMGPVFCVIGLKHDDDKIYSVRPVSPETNGWRYFPYGRGDVLRCDLAALGGARPHVEDRLSSRGFEKETTVCEGDVVKYLRRAECSSSLPELF